MQVLRELAPRPSPSGGGGVQAVASMAGPLPAPTSVRTTT